MEIGQDNSAPVWTSLTCINWRARHNRASVTANPQHCSLGLKLVVVGVVVTWSVGWSAFKKYSHFEVIFSPLCFLNFRQCGWAGILAPFQHGGKNTPNIFRIQAELCIHWRGAAGAPEQWKCTLSHLASRRCHTLVSSDWQDLGRPWLSMYCVRRI